MPAYSGTTHDIVLDEQGYMLSAGRGGSISYDAGAKSGASVGMYPVNLTDVEALQGAGVAATADMWRRLSWGNWRGAGRKYADGWAGAEKAGLVSDLVGLRPVLDGQALVLAPQSVSAQVDAAGLNTSAFHSVAFGADQYISVGPKLFKSANPGTNNSGLTSYITAGGVFQGLAVWQNALLMSFGGGGIYTDGGGFLTLWASSRAAELLLAYQGALFASYGSSLYWYIPATGTWSGGIALAGQITALEEHSGSLYIGTPSALYRLDGTLKAKAPSTAPTVLDWFDYRISVAWRVPAYSLSGFWTESNFVKMVSWGGYLWAFVSGRLVRLTAIGTVQSGAASVVVEYQPVQGGSLGLAICGGLLVAIVSSGGGPNSIWVNDGSLLKDGGWWKLLEETTILLPFSNAGYTQGVVNCVNTGAGTYTFTRWLLNPGSPLGFKADNYGVTRATVTGKVTLPLMMPDDLASSGDVQALQMLRVGCEWSVIDGGAGWPTLDATSTATSLMKFEISQDGGYSWTLLAEPAFSKTWYSLGPSNFRGSRVEFPVSSGQAATLWPASPVYNGGAVSDPHWLIRVTWEGLIMPLLRRVWVDVKPVKLSAVTGRVWDFDLMLSQPLIGLDNQNDVEASLTKLGRLWAVWKSQATVGFEDLDGATHPVKLVGLDVKRAAQGALPNLAVGWLVGVKLQEVFV